MLKIEESYKFIKNKLNGIEPKIGVVLGTGLGKLVDSISIKVKIPYCDIPNFPVSTVESHQGQLIVGELNGVLILAMQGRFHYYEGYSMQEITLPIRIFKKLGIRNLIISNAAGAINSQFEKGNIMLITDHINLQFNNPLIGPNLDEFGPRFPDMSNPYSEKIGELVRRSALKNSILLYEGVYASMQGPCLETRAEYRLLSVVGADAVGMSTVPEVIVANHCGINVVALSVLTDECDPDNLKPVMIDEIIRIAEKAEVKLIKLVEDILPQI